MRSMVLLRTAENKSRRRSIDKEEDIIAAIGLIQLRHYFYPKEQPNHLPFEDNRSTTTPATTTTTRQKSRSSVVKDLQISKTMNGQGRRTTRPRKKAEIKGSDKGFIVTTPHLKEEEEVKKRLRMGLVDKFKVQDDEESKSDDGSYITDDSSDMETTLAEITAAQQIVLLSKSHQQPATATTRGGEEEEEEETSSSRSSAGVVSSTTRRRKQDFEDESRRRRRKRKFRSLVDLYKITQPLV